MMRSGAAASGAAPTCDSRTRRFTRRRSRNRVLRAAPPEAAGASAANAENAKSLGAKAAWKETAGKRPPGEPGGRFGRQHALSRSAAEALVGNVVGDHGVLDRRRVRCEQSAAFGCAGGECVVSDRAAEQRQRPVTAVPDATAYSGAARAPCGPAVAAEGGVADRQHRPEGAEAAALDTLPAGRRGGAEGVSAGHAG